MAFVDEILQVQLQRHVQRQDHPAAEVPREGLQPAADRILELQHEVQRQAWPTVSVPRGRLQTLVKSLLELQHQKLTKRRCHSMNLSLHHEHDGTFRGTGHHLHYRVHPKALALRCETRPSSLLQSTEMKMRQNNQ